MAQVFQINAATRPLQLGWRINEVIGGRNTMTFKVLALDASWRPARGQTVSFVDDSVPYTWFAGHLHSVDEGGLGGYGVPALEFYCTAVDYNALPERRLVELTIPKTATLKAALTTIVTFLAPYGTTLSGSQPTGPTLSDFVDEDLVFELGTVTAILDKLQVITGNYYWNINYANELLMEIVGTSGSIVAGSFGAGDIKVTTSSEGFANFVTVQFTNAGRAAFAYLEADLNWVATETVTIGSKIYTFVADVTGAGNVNGNVLIGGTIAESLDRLERAITLGGAGGGADYAETMSINTQVTAGRVAGTPGLLQVTALTIGVAGNTIGVETSNGDAQWIIGGGGQTVSTLEFGRDDSFTGRAIADGGAAAADRVDRNYPHPEVRDLSTAQALANGYLVRDSVASQETRLLSFAAQDVHCGWGFTFTEATRNMSGYHIVTGRDISSVGNHVHYDLTLRQGVTVVPESKLELFRAWSRGRGRTATLEQSLVGAGLAAQISTAPPTGVIHLGGSDSASVLMATVPAMLPIANYVSFIPRVSFTGLMRSWIWSRSGAEAWCYFVNVTDSASVVSAGVSSSVRPATPGSTYVALIAGKEYRAEIKGPSEDDCWAIVTLEAA